MNFGSKSNQMNLILFEGDQNPVELKNLIGVKDGGGSSHEIWYKLSEPFRKVHDLIVRALTNTEPLD